MPLARHENTLPVNGYISTYAFPFPSDDDAAVWNFYLTGNILHNNSVAAHECLCPIR